MTVATEFALAGVREDSRLRILLVEDDPNDAELVQACLAEAARSGAEIVHAASLDGALRALEGPPFHITVTHEGDGLMAQATGQRKFPIFAESPTKFFSDEPGVTATFVLGDKGPASEVVVKVNGREIHARRVSQ